MDIAVIILAAGQSKRIQSKHPKVLHRICGLPLLEFPLRLAATLKAKPVVVVVPKKPNPISDYLSDHKSVRQVVQTEALGTGHAVAQAESALRGFFGTVLILSGDVPLLRLETLRAFVTQVTQQKRVLGLLTTHVPNPTGYGRIVRDVSGQITAIVEEKEADESVRTLTEINPAIYCVQKSWLFAALKKLKRHTTSGEYYLTDIIAEAVAQGESIESGLIENFQECLGVNTRAELAAAQSILQQKIIEGWLSKGVSFVDPRNTTVDADVQIGPETLIHPNVSLRGQTRIGKNCVMDVGVVLTDTVVADEVVIKPYSVLESSRVGFQSQIGPFARLRPGATLKSGVRVGNFVEIKKSLLEKGVKINHLSYIGDASIGSGTNVGCGTITCNYDGAQKHRTVIGSGVFVGSDVQFVAPIKVGQGAVIGAGSTITENVPAKALALARSRQVNKKSWNKKRKK